jgi:NADP-reducing hydrogenase subunit HndB
MSHEPRAASDEPPATGGQPGAARKLRPGDLEQIAARMRRAISLREGAGRAKITVHMGTCGIAAGARKIMSVVLRCLERSEAKDVLVTTSGCAGLCSREPMMTVELSGAAPVKYVDLTESKVERIFSEHVLNGKIVAELALALGSEQTL